jgi:hypothetical protein
MKLLLKVILLVLFSQILFGQSDNIGSGRAINFDGIDDFINLGNVYDDLKLPLTISAWVNIDQSVSTWAPVFVSQDNSSIYNGFWFIVQPTRMSIGYGGGEGENNEAFRRSKAADFLPIGGRWVHLCAVIRGAIDMDLYINGINVGGEYSGSSNLPIIAMRWYYKLNREVTGEAKLNLKDVLKALINEPVNLVVVTAILLLTVGIRYDAFPGFLQSGIDKLSLMMTPLVLLFIGMSVKFTWAQVRTIFSFLFFRTGVAFLLSAVVLIILQPVSLSTALLIVIFPQSACSFWPYAHMAAVGKLEAGHGKSSGTFDLEFAMNILACSLPFSVILVMIMYTAQDVFASPLNVSGFGLLCLVLAAAPALIPVFTPKSQLKEQA